ncbi:MerR family transcriptional regulator [Streptomyces sp. NPDC001941]|uniref:MerR family transcriptional regulator n=1 Tax=Streptomyces sp. NPDC001941 TaxID=3154659 RepID=UPI0033171F69
MLSDGGGPDASGPWLTTGAVALRLGVAPTTLRSWERRYGIGPGERRPGRHRRWSPRDVALLEDMCRLTAAGVAPADAARAARAGDAAAAFGEHGGGPVRPGRGQVPRMVRGLGRAAVRLDAPRVEALLAGAVAEWGAAVAWDQVMAPALRAVGRRWAGSGDAAGERYVEAEHLLSWHVSTALRRAPAGPAPQEGERPVVLAGAPGEQHSLALEALAAVLGERGAAVRMFGPAVPPGALTEAVRRTGPRAVVLWAQTRGTADRLLPSLVRSVTWGVAGARVSPAVLLAGPGWSRTGPHPGTLRPMSLDDALALLGRTGRVGYGAGTAPRTLPAIEPRVPSPATTGGPAGSGGPPGPPAAVPPR